MVSIKKALVLIIVLTLGIAFRFWRLDQIPPSLNWDEVSHAYTAYSLLETGRDQWGQILPVLNFRAYGDYPTTLNVYLTVPFIALFGPTDLTVRLPHALMGALTIVSMFLAVYYFKRSYMLAVIAAVITAFEPWGLFTSRTVLQANVAVFLLSLGMALYFKRKSLWIFVLTLFAYHNTRIFVPLLAIYVFIIGMRRPQYKWLLLAAAGFVILAFPQTRSRGGWVGLLDQGAIGRIESLRNNSSLPPTLSRLVYNRPTYFVSKSLTNYAGYFSPNYLFFAGGTQYQFSLPNHGVLYWLHLPFTYIGLIATALGSPVLLGWMILSPLPAAITADKFAVVRSTTMIPLIYLATSMGIWWAYKTLPRKIGVYFLIIFAVAYSGLFLSYWRRYIYDYPIHYSASWQYGHKQMVDYIRGRYDQYDQVIVSKKYGEPHEFIMWYWPIHPRDWQNTLVRWDYHDNWYWVNGFGKFVFVNDWEMDEYIESLDTSQKYLIVSSPDNPANKTLLETVSFLDGSPAFIISHH